MYFIEIKIIRSNFNKMKTIILFLSLLLLTFKIGHSQTNVYHPFPDSAAVWNMHLYSGFCYVDAYYSITISGDTLISGQTYHKLIIPSIQVVSGGGCPLPAIGYKGAIRQDILNKKVFYIPPANSTEQLLYDFNMQTGDPVKGFIEESFFSPSDTVKSIDSVLVGSSYRKRWNINSCYGISFIEGIGSTYGLIQLSPGCATDQADYSIACFKQHGVTLYPSTTTNCELITSVNFIEKNSNQIKIFPNPSNGQVNLLFGNKINNATLKLMTVMGQTIMEKTNLAGDSFTFDISGEAKGFYFLEVKEAESVSRIKLVKN